MAQSNAGRQRVVDCWFCNRELASDLTCNSKCLDLKFETKLNSLDFKSDFTD